MATTDKILIINPNTGEVVEQRDIAAKAENVGVVPAGNITDTNLQDVLEDMDSRIGQGGGSTQSSASGVSYDNTDSELEADNVQEAIDEVAAIAKTAASSPSGVPTAFERNRGRGSVLFSQAKYYYGGSPVTSLPQFLIVTDNHGTGQCIKNAVSIANGFPSIRGIFQLGDILAASWADNAYAQEGGDGTFAGCSKPVYTVIGNHDVGNSTDASKCASNSQLYNTFIKPMADGWTTAGGEANLFTKSVTQRGSSYTLKAWFDKAGEEKCYWYQDTLYEVYKSGSGYNVRKMRIIGINEYDYPNDENSFFTDESHTTYKFKKGESYVSQSQAEWLRDVLLSCATDSIDSIVVLTHQSPFRTNASTAKEELTFCTNGAYENFYAGQYVYAINGSPQYGIVYSILNAFASRTSEQITVNPKLYGTFSLASYEVSCDFTGVPSGIVLCPVFAGHSHTDAINAMGNVVVVRSTNTGKHDVQGDIYHGKPMTAQGVMNGLITDDSINVVTFDPDEKVVKLCKLGATYTVDGYERDQEEFNWETLASPVYGDKQVKAKIDALES